MSCSLRNQRMDELTAAIRSSYLGFVSDDDLCQLRYFSRQTDADADACQGYRNQSRSSIHVQIVANLSPDWSADISRFLSRSVQFLVLRYALVSAASHTETVTG